MVFFSTWQHLLHCRKRLLLLYIVYDMIYSIWYNIYIYIYNFTCICLRHIEGEKKRKYVLTNLKLINYLFSSLYSNCKCSHPANLINVYLYEIDWRGKEKRSKCIDYWDTWNWKSPFFSFSRSKRTINGSMNNWFSIWQVGNCHEIINGSVNNWFAIWQAICS